LRGPPVRSSRWASGQTTRRDDLKVDHEADHESDHEVDHEVDHKADYELDHEQTTSRPDHTATDGAQQLT